MEGSYGFFCCIYAAHGLGFWTDRSAVHEAAAQGRAVQLQKLIENGASVNIVAVDSITPLHEACIQGHTQCVKLLLDAGAHVRTTTLNKYKMFPKSCTLWCPVLFLRIRHLLNMKYYCCKNL